MAEVEYPESDGEPMGESGIHVLATLHLLGALRYFLREYLNIYVIADMFLYYEEGNPRSVKAPDVMVVKGIDASYERKSFKTWEEEAVPAVIFEVSSPSTAIEDMTSKHSLYEALQISEYFIFDPLGEYLPGQIRGFRLERNRYLPIRPNSDGTLTSYELNARLRVEDYLLRIIDPVTNKPVPGLNEAMYEAERAMKRAEQEAQRAEQEAQRAEQEAQRAEQEAQRADAAEAEIERQRQIIEQLRKHLPENGSPME
ncbi:MAG: Uma2 family endonuclease [Caldilineaceae bacterium]|nr:Uma2 family endonuclease [Caldilineaceae bacterium]HRJ45190.1 Uma2 family endonuclease [Caldilineaceae bacterium]